MESTRDFLTTAPYIKCSRQQRQACILYIAQGINASRCRASHQAPTHLTSDDCLFNRLLQHAAAAARCLPSPVVAASARP